ncbi:MAG: phosphoglycolate phosphatase [Methanothrix sp.]|uniref:phosphoglycolate phosphatase n=1 Tax=Methanothrix sp. TaxID=90426 RepID=UPI0032AF17AC|nr:phosphoglycolate phosphatase [Methanothrix sp.]
MIEAVAVDIDGTLTDERRVLSPVSVSVIRELDVPVILVTGNTHCFTRAAAVLLGVRHFVAENGGVISSDDRIEVVGDRKMCDEAYEHLKERFGIKKFDSRYRLTDLVLIRGFDVDAASRYLESLNIPVELVDTGFAIHIKNRGVTKGTGLRRISERLGIPTKRIAAIGDSPSDIPMMEISGFPAAVGNAHPAVKSAARYVADRPFGDGFAEIIDHMRSSGMI